MNPSVNNAAVVKAGFAKLMRVFLQNSDSSFRKPLLGGESYAETDSTSADD